jgi:hypothetical protein
VGRPRSRHPAPPRADLVWRGVGWICCARPGPGGLHGVCSGAAQAEAETRGMNGRRCRVGFIEMRTVETERTTVRATPSAIRTTRLKRLRAVHRSPIKQLILLRPYALKGRGCLI